MQTLQLIYKNGHFYDKNSKMRISLADSTEIVMVTPDNSLVLSTPIGTKRKPLTYEEQQKILKSKDIDNQLKLLSNGQILYFEIAVRSKSGDLNHPIFEVELLEDLYIYYKKTWKLREFRLWECACVVRKIHNSLPYSYFEEIYATSLNELYKNTYIHYFGNKGNPAINAADNFYNNYRFGGLSLKIRDLFPSRNDKY